MPQWFSGNGGGGSGSPTSTTSSPFVPAENPLDLDNPAVLSGGVLTIPISPIKYAAYNMTGAAGPYAINKIANVPAYVIELRNTGTIQTVFTGTPESTAVANDLVIETPGTITLFGAGDWITFRKITGEVFNRKVGASTYFD